MKIQFSKQSPDRDYTRVDRIILHLRCLARDHKYRWHLTGVWREVTLH